MKLISNNLNKKEKNEIRSFENLYQSDLPDDVKEALFILFPMGEKSIIFQDMIRFHEDIIAGNNSY